MFLTRKFGLKIFFKYNQLENCLIHIKFSAYLIIILIHSKEAWRLKFDNNNPAASFLTVGC